MLTRAFGYEFRNSKVNIGSVDVCVCGSYESMFMIMKRERKRKRESERKRENAGLIFFILT